MSRSSESESSRGAGVRGAEIRHLAALVAIARERSFRAAARRVGVAQSALSRQISELERAVGARLVARSPRSVDARLTEAGRLMLAHAEAVLARLEAAQLDLAAIGDRPSLRVGVDDAIATRVLPGVLQRLDGIQIEAHETRDDEELLDAVERGTIDLAFSALPLGPGPFDSEALLDEAYVLLVPADWVLAHRAEPIREMELPSMPLICRDGARGSQYVEAYLRSCGRPSKIVRRADSDAGVRALVGAGIGVAILPRLSVDPRDSATVAIELGAAVGSRTLALVWHRFRRLPPAARRFRAAASIVCMDLARDWEEIEALERLKE